MGSAAQFVLEIDRDLEQALDEWRATIEQIALAALERIVARTPVDTGRARGSWIVTIGEVSFEVTTEVDRDGAVTIAQGAQVIATYRTRNGFPEIIIQSNLDYILRLENGWSQQAPAGMVAITAIELEAQA